MQYTRELLKRFLADLLLFFLILVVILGDLFWSRVYKRKWNYLPNDCFDCRLNLKHLHRK